MEFNFFEGCGRDDVILSEVGFSEFSDALDERGGGCMDAVEILLRQRHVPPRQSCG